MKLIQLYAVLDDFFSCSNLRISIALFTSSADEYEIFEISRENSSFAEFFPVYHSVLANIEIAIGQLTRTFFSASRSVLFSQSDELRVHEGNYI